MANKVTLVGYLGGDPELNTYDGTTVANFRLATTERWKKDGDKVERTEWHNVVAWGKLADICGKHLTKGSHVYLEGRLETQSWDSDGGMEHPCGKKHYKTQVVVRTLEMLGRKNGRQSPVSADDEQEAGALLPDNTIPV